MNPLRLGKRDPVRDNRDLLAARYVDFAALPAVPSRFGYGKIYADWGMLGNGPDPTVAPGFQGAGCCVFSGAAHEHMEANAIAGHPVQFTGRNVISDYSAVTGYVIDDSSTDNGTAVRTAMAYRQKTGIVDASGNRHRITAYVAIQLQNWLHLQQACYVFGAVGMGFRFPDSAWNQLGGLWDVVPGTPDPVEGHYVPVVGTMNSTTKMTCLTWGKRQEFTRAFFEAYNDELWAFILPDELRGGQGLHHLDMAALSADLSTLGVVV